MIFDLRDLRELEEFTRARRIVYFRLTGGLGNQLFGLSEAYGVHKKFGTGVAIDVGALEHSLGNEPEWLEWSEKQEWITLVRIPKNVSSEFILVNLGDEYADVNWLDAKYFTGWKFSLERVRDTGLFREGEYPFGIVKTDCAGVAVHYRVGDYANAQGIGVLDTSYYLKAIKLLGLKGQIEFFSDDNESAQEMIELNKLPFAKVSGSTRALDVLSQISKANYIVAGNSTLSWWGIYFSSATKVICPTPFYLQDWNFDSKARFQKALYLSRFRNPCQELLTWFLWRLRSLRIRGKS